MKAFATLLERLVLTPSRNRKMEIIRDYCASRPDPYRGYAIGAITGDLKLKSVQPSLLRELMTQRIDAELFRLSYDYVGDLAETVSLLWGPAETAEAPPPLSQVVEMLSSASKSDTPAILSGLLDAMDVSSRYALIKLATGGLRIGVSARLAKQALAEFGNVKIEEIEELWHGLEPPYSSLFAWLDGSGAKPVAAGRAPFRPVMLSNAIEERELEDITPADFLAEWKWDGIRIQLVSDRGKRRIYSRTGEDISPAFPDLVEAMAFEGTFDGELLVRSPLGEPLAIRTFSDLQQRLNRKIVPKGMLSSHPAFARLYDCLLDGENDLREQNLEQRRNALAMIVDRLPPERFDLSPEVSFTSVDDLRDKRANPPHPVIEGLMLKRRQSTYRSGRPRGLWYKWKRDPMVIDAVLMYAQRGHGKRSGYYSDFTFGAWRDGETGMELVPVGKAYFGFTDAELKQLDKYVRKNTTERFGPVRSVAAGMDGGLVLEIAFEGINRSNRHKSGVAMRFPRISQIRWDKPAAEADRLEALEALIGD
ncbi:MAG: cisplatin damage response ATP-dependent DNA ligase [Nitratireductor sp.]|nr:cisplatin damage response ATP-dependent DNA ligase [Nitratireductor sp.]